MGATQENIYNFTHRSITGGSPSFGFRRHQDSTSLESEVHCTHQQGSAILDAAQVDQATFDSACATQFGSWYTSLNNDEKAVLRQCCIDQRAI